MSRPCVARKAVYMLQVVAELKGKMLTVKVARDVLREFKIAVESRGSTMSNFVRMFVAKTIRDEKERNPKAFEVKTSDRERPVVTARIRKAAKKKREG